MWTITSCIINTSTVLSGCHIRSNEMKLSVIGDDIEIFPDLATVGKVLLEAHNNRMISYWDIKLSDSIVVEDDITIPLGNLTITFLYNAPCPILDWNGSSKSFKELKGLNDCFARLIKMKAFW